MREALPEGNDMLVYSYDTIHNAASKSIQVIGPLVMDLLQPRRVVDLGCGTGDWLGWFLANGATDILGADGPWVRKDMLQFPVEKLVITDLGQPFTSDRSFDLAVSVEVAEHLPEASARTFVASLCGLAPAVVFSAAIPFQGGEYHVNEQWQSYWRALFEQQGYVPVDYFRPILWNNEAAQWWYRQNMLLYVRPELFEANPRLRAAHEATLPDQLDLVHPIMYLEKAGLAANPDPRNLQLGRVLAALPVIAKTSLKRSVKRMLGRE
jgi:SAM-dependent methyltransferase